MIEHFTGIFLSHTRPAIYLTTSFHLTWDFLDLDVCSKQGTLKFKMDSFVVVFHSIRKEAKLQIKI
jgi:hypothetical protein